MSKKPLAINDKRIQKIRKQYHRAYESWSEKEDSLLKQVYKKIQHTDELAVIFQRNPGAIKSRFKKLGLMIDNKKDTSGDLEMRATSARGSESSIREIVCLANSRKYYGCCIAGKEVSKSESKKWIRPVSSRNTGELQNNEIKLKDGGSPKLLDIITLSTKKYFPHFYQTENHLNDRKSVWVKKGEYPISGLKDICDNAQSIWINGYDSTSGKNDRIPIEITNEKCESSLLLIQPEQLKLRIESGLTFKQRIRASFLHHDIPYNFAVTDSFADAYYADKPEGWYEIEKGEIYMCVSLGEPFQGFCYKLVAGIIGL